MSLLYIRPQQYYSPILLALLSSSCCVIQLVLNLFSIGCAGLSVLTPYRWIFTALLVLSLYRILSTPPRLSKSKVLVVLVALLLALSPEMVRTWNEGGLVVGSGAARLTRFSSLWNRGKVETPQQQQHVLAIEGMKCDACANRIKRQLQALPGVSAAKVFQSNGSAVVMMSDNAIHELESWTRSMNDQSDYR
ncbi:hypothetical protein BZG36_04841, partial [Bifiguratus adelaidae]